MVDSVALAMAGSKPTEGQLETRAFGRQDGEQIESQSFASSTRLFRPSPIGIGETSERETDVGYTEYRQGLNIDTGSREAFRVRKKIDCVIIPIFFISKSPV
jgi:hypothetical protein